MALNITIKTGALNNFFSRGTYILNERVIFIFSLALAALSTVYFYSDNLLISYGDAESHLNIAKRVIDSLTPGFAQLGGIWLPLPHLLLVPFVKFDFLWRTGLAGSIVSGIAFIISAVYIYKLVVALTGNSKAAFFGSLVFMLNPNILYLQSTPMTEITLIAFFILSSYYFILFLQDSNKILMLILAAFFGFCASLSRYDGWALILMEAGILFLYYLALNFKGESIKKSLQSFKARWNLFEGRVILFATLAFFGVVLWLLWGFLILGDPLYFTHSQFSANSQQQNWLRRGELPAYHNIGVAFLYYFVTSMSTGGVLLFFASIFGLFGFLSDKKFANRFFIVLLLLVPFFFNIATLFIGQSVIFIPSITPGTFEWNLFNVRYGVLMVPVVAFFTGYLFSKKGMFGKSLLIGLLVLQSILYFIGYSPVLALDDGVKGLSSATAKIPDAQNWLATNYDYGLILTDDYARTISIIRTPINMEDVIYIGNKPYWEESLVEPEKYARWIVMQKNDDVWKNLNDKPEINARMFKYFNKVYTSDEILIFRRIDEGA